MAFLVKVCGVTRPEDAAMAAQAGADAIGLNFWHGSKRFVKSEQQAKEIISAVPRGVLTVGLFVNAHPLVVTETLRDLKLDRIQLHGDERVGDWAEIGKRNLIRALRVSDEASLKEALGWDVDLFICDAFAERAFGGTGKLAPWDLIASYAPKPFLLAGGLNPENVSDGIRVTRPTGVDVSSGTEKEPGIKDADLTRRFIDNALACAKELGLG